MKLTIIAGDIKVKKNYFTSVLKWSQFDFFENEP